MRIFRLKPIAFSLIYLFSHASLADEDALKLKPDLGLRPPSGQQEALPIFIEAESIEGQGEEKITAQGSAVLRKRGQAIFADRLTYFLSEDEIEAEGNVRLEQRGDSVQGPKLKVNVERNTGYFDSPEFRLQQNQSGGSATPLFFESRGTASQLFLEGPQQYRLEQANYTTCPVGNDDWYLRARDLKIDQENNVGVARDASIVFKGVPILYTPWIDFPTSNSRKSGFLPPTMGNTSNNGFEFELPYYWNIAPNYDATLSPRVMSKRGTQFNSEFRYLEPTYSGLARVDLLPDDQIKNDDTRAAILLQHTQNFGNGLSGSVNYQRVSDNSYFRDLSTRIAFTSQVTLPQEGVLSYSQPWWNVSLVALGYQTLQPDPPAAPITPPYQPLPQLTVNAARQNVGGFDLSLTSQYTNFNHASLVNGQRLMAYPSISYPLQSSYAYFTPKIGVSYTHYSFYQNSTTAPDTDRVVPISSIETGLIFERDTSFFGQDFKQTLEPTVYYLNIPFRDQSQIPVFDSALADVNYSRIFTENVFSGGDRINNANQLTVGIRSRLLSDNGDERLRFNLGQRLLIGQQRVSLNSTVPDSQTGPGTTTTPSVDTTSDIIAVISSRIIPKVLAEAGLEYQPSSSTGQRAEAGLRYQPEPGKVLNLSYSFIRGSIEQTDISTQWPLGGGWYGLGRFNYSLRDSTTLEGLLGFEYNSCCWTMRLVVHRL
ncbi:MAG TPA: LPS-assembly protein LptD, partial [Burkholderiales bacterium]